MNKFGLCRLIETEMPMDRSNDPQELKRQIEQATRLASVTTDLTTYQRLKEFAEELRQRLQRRLVARRSTHAIRARARELWEQHGRPTDRDLEFWLRAERELSEDENE
jgi:predicted RNA-binding Zn ribbon-like protein